MLISASKNTLRPHRRHFTQPRTILALRVSQDLRSHFPESFRREMRLDDKPSAGKVVGGPDTALLDRMGLHTERMPRPPTAHPQRTFGSPRRLHHTDIDDIGFATSNGAGDKLRLSWESWQAGGIRGRSLPASPPRRWNDSGDEKRQSEDHSRSAM